MIAIDDVVAIVAASIAKEDELDVSLFSVLTCIKEELLPIIRAVAILCGIVQSNDSC